MATTSQTKDKPTWQPDKSIQFVKKSGKGIQEGVISELTTLFEIKPGKEEEVRAGVKRFADYIRKAPLEATVHTGLRSSRHVVFNNGRHLMWLTTFENEWEPYIEDAVIVIGIERFLDWMQHTTASDKVDAWVRDAGGIDTLRAAAGSFLTDPAREKAARMSTGGLKDVINSVQFPAAAYFDPLADLTHPQIRKAVKVNEAFQKVLDNPDAAQALRQPALKPLLDLASE
jgi:hypothetical protein